MSESLGFIFVFALIVSAVGLTYAVGLGGLEQTRDVERVNNAERAFDVLADNVDDLARRGAPSRATEIKLADAGLSFGDPAVINVSVEEADAPTNNVSVEYEVTPIVFDAGTGTSLAYSSGGVIREQSGGAVMTRSPSWVVSSERVLVPVIETRRGKNASAVGGTTTVLVRTDAAASNLEVVNRTASYNVTVNVSSPRAPAWRRFMADAGMSCPSDRNSETFASCERSRVARVYVVVHKVDVSIE